MSSDKIAEERIELLFGKAEEVFEENPDLADRYVEIARSIGERSQVSIPSDLKKKFCSNCGSFLKPGKNCSVEVKSSEDMIYYSCGECGETDKYGN